MMLRVLGFLLGLLVTGTAAAESRGKYKPPNCESMDRLRYHDKNRPKSAIWFLNRVVKGEVGRQAQMYVFLPPRFFTCVKIGVRQGYLGSLFAYTARPIAKGWMRKPLRDLKVRPDDFRLDMDQVVMGAGHRYGPNGALDRAYLALGTGETSTARYRYYLLGPHLKGYENFVIFNNPTPHPRLIILKYHEFYIPLATVEAWGIGRLSAAVENLANEYIAQIPTPLGETREQREWVIKFMAEILSAHMSGATQNFDNAAIATLTSLTTDFIIREMRSRGWVNNENAVEIRHVAGAMASRLLTELVWVVRQPVPEFAR